MSKFKVGDKVLYRAVHGGCVDLDGWCGTVVYVDDTEAPYTVRFDHSHPDAVTDGRAPKMIKEGDQSKCYDWFCKEEHLCLIDEEGLENTGDMPHKQRRTAMGRKRGSIYDVPDEVCRQIRKMVEDGMSVGQMAEALGYTYNSMKNLLCHLRKKDPTFPRSANAWGVASQADAVDYKALYQEAQCIMDKLREEIFDLNGLLNELTEQSAHCQTELRQENDMLRGRCAEMEKVISALQNATLDRQEVITQMRAKEQELTNIVLTLLKQYVLLGASV